MKYLEYREWRWFEIDDTTGGVFMCCPKGVDAHALWSHHFTYLKPIEIMAQENIGDGVILLPQHNDLTVSVKHIEGLDAFYVNGRQIHDVSVLDTSLNDSPHRILLSDIYQLIDISHNLSKMSIASVVDDNTGSYHYVVGLESPADVMKLKMLL